MDLYGGALCDVLRCFYNIMNSDGGEGLKVEVVIVRSSLWSYCEFRRVS